MSAQTQSDEQLGSEGEKRRDFMVLSSAALTGVGAAAALWPFVDSMNPSADVLAMASIEVNLDPVETGQEIKVMWRGKPIFIRHRTGKDIEEAESVEMSALKDPEPDSARVKEGHTEWLVMIGICTHLGCVPLGNNSGEFDGWFCPCHGSHYDTAGRIRKGPAPKNLVIPPYEFLSDTKIKIG